MATFAPRSASRTARSLPTRRPPVISTTLSRRPPAVSVVVGIAISKSFPKDVESAGAAIDRAGQDEQEVAEPVQVDDQNSGHVLAPPPRQLHDQSLGAPADRPRQVELRGGQYAAGK